MNDRISHRILDSRASRRRRAVDDLPDTDAAMYALRSVMLLDRDATVRERAAQRLGRAISARGREAGLVAVAGLVDRDPASARLRAWLEAACEDAAPSVREAAYRSIARLRDPASVPHLCRACAREPVWSVRRAAVVALAAIIGARSTHDVAGDAAGDVTDDVAGDKSGQTFGPLIDQALSALLRVLDDPFWRVRYTCARALCVLGAADADVRERVLGARPETEWALAALEYVRRAWSEALPPSPSSLPSSPTSLPSALPRILEPAPRPEPVRLADAGVDPVWDADPAVMSARLARPEIQPSRALLLEAMADSHESLRKQAVARLRESGDAAMLRAALTWLDEPRFPHAGTSVHAVLDNLGDGARALAVEVLERAHGDAGTDRKTDREADRNTDREADRETDRETDREADSPVAPGPGAQAWALSWIARTECTELGHLVRPCTMSDHAVVRAAAADALARLVRSPHGTSALADPRASTAAALAPLLHDTDDRVVLAAARALADCHHADALRALATLRITEQPVLVQRAVVDAALRFGDHGREGEQLLALVCTALQDDLDALSPWECARVLSTLAERDALPPALRRAAAEHPDPWLRGAVPDSERVRAVLADHGEADPQVRRAALALLVEARSAVDARAPGTTASIAAAAAHDSDPWIRARACALLTPEDNAQLRSLLGLSADRDAMVRSAAAERLQACTAIDQHLAALLSEPRAAMGTDAGVDSGAGDAADDRIRASAHTWLARAFDEPAGERLARALASGVESPAVTAHIAAMLVAFPEVIARHGIALPAPEPRAPRAANTTGREPAVVARRALGQTGIHMSPLVISGAYELSTDSLRQAYEAGVDSFFWEPRHQAMTRFLRRPPCARDDITLISGSFHGSPSEVQADIDRALRRLGTDHLDVFLLFWVRSRARVTDEMRRFMQRMVDAGKIRAAGLSTHDRALAAEAIREQAWDVVMTRHNAAHRGVEREVLPAARAARAGVLTFSALCYGQMLRPSSATPSAPSAADCYRYSLSQAGVSACISAPRRHGELVHNLEVLARPTLESAELAALRAHGDVVYRRNKDFNALIRREPRADWLARERVAETVDQLDQLFDEVAPPGYF